MSAPVVGDVRGPGTPSVQTLWDIEQIKQLKARYFRLLDTKDWDGFADLFTDDCEHVLPSTASERPRSNDEYLDMLRSTMSSGVTVHHGHMPEITITGPDEASGIWAMSDDIDVRGQGGVSIRLRGQGHYFETYRRCPDGVWRISSKRNVRLRVDTPSDPSDA